MTDQEELKAQPSWVELYRSVLRLGPILERPAGPGGAAEGQRLHAEFCRWLRVHLLAAGCADEPVLARLELSAAIEGENWQAVWSGARTVPTRPSP